MSDNGSEGEDKEEGPTIGVYEGGRNGANERHGIGKAIFPNGDIYEGRYAQGKREGQGSYKWKAEHRYNGMYSDNQRHGVGYFVYPDGSKYKGDFIAGKRHGNGTYVYSNGDAYQGSWEADFKSGRGIYTFQNGCKKSGTWVDGKLNGPGEIVYPDHKIKGSFKNDDVMDMPVTIHYTQTGYSQTIHDPTHVGMEIEPSK
ncbi:hypothetical protein BASA50_000501 [Batrachochytrium salamandrivorans]|uniref:Uncharacterized protein n=1 Tax=Batrachochytrium salamandrivorans TaxID=1357716 RepID=A0ABQ8EV14_9FUNG|nr:hypothetical protein BASA50_000501 [Batrachochytrium salamandrivorans]